MELNQEIKLKITPEQSELLINISFIGISITTLLLSIFFTVVTFWSINSQKPPASSSQILNIEQINQAYTLLSEKTIDFSQSN